MTKKHLGLALIGALGISEAAIAKDHGFAVWNAASDVAAGTEVTVPNGEFVERGYLRPVGLIRTSASIMNLESGKVILPAGALLARMSGVASPQYCTWNHGQTFADERQRARLKITSKGALLCVSFQPNGSTAGLEYVSGQNAILLREYTFDLAGGAKSVNSVHAEVVDPRTYYQDVEFGPVYAPSRARGADVACLRWAARVNGSKEKAFFGDPKCLPSGAGTIELDGARYIIRQSAVGVATIKIDLPFVLNALNLRVIEKTSFRP
jgi:hypothetical protein